MQELYALYPEHIKKVIEDVQKLLKNTSYESVVFFSGTQHFYHADDLEIPFRASAHFKRFVPINKINHALVITKDKKELTLVSYKPEDYWVDHSEEGDTFWKSEVEVVEVPSIERLKEEVACIVGTGTAAYIGEPFEALSKDWNPKEMVSELDELRNIKTVYEVACIQTANKKAVLGHRALENEFKEGASEQEMYLSYLNALKATEHDMPYPPIIALNEKGSVLHYEHKRHERFGKTCLIDAGAEVNGYASDITRTYAHSDAPEIFHTLIRDMDELQQELVSQTTPGVDLVDLDRVMREKIAVLFLKHEIITEQVGEKAMKAVAHFIPHSIGHMLGLQVHDVGGKEKDGEHMRLLLKPGMVTTIEPGIYFNEMLLKKLERKEEGEIVNWDLVKTLIPYGGIRIEDNVHVTKNGPVNLTREAFSKLT